MAVPATAKPFDQALDPRDQVEFYQYLYQGDPAKKPAPLLLPGEGVASWAIAPSAEAVAVGLEIVDDPARQAFLDGNLITLWLRVAEDKRDLVIFDTGVTVGIEVTIVTTADPARTKHRTFLVRIARQ